MKKVLALAFAVLTAGCVMRHWQYDYFEPTFIGESKEQPKPSNRQEGATRFFGPVKLDVGASAQGGGIGVYFHLLLPRGSSVRFLSNKVKLVVEGHEEVIEPVWREWTIVNGIGREDFVPLDAPLKPQSYTKAPATKGVENTGDYSMQFSIPQRYISVEKFQLFLPPVEGSEKWIEILFVRRSADYWESQKIALVLKPNQSDYRQPPGLRPCGV